MIELSELDIETGRAYKFYDHCYIKLTNKTENEGGKVILEPKPQKLLELIKQLEVEHDC